MSTHLERRLSNRNVNRSTHSLIYPFTKHPWSACCSPGTVLYTMNTAVGKTHVFALTELARW